MDEAEREQRAERERAIAQHPQEQDIKRGSTPLLPSVCRKLPATTGVGTVNGSAATNPRAGRTPSLRLTPRINADGGEDR